MPSFISRLLNPSRRFPATGRVSRTLSLAIIAGVLVLGLATANAANPALKDYLQALLVAATPLDGNASAVFLSPGRDPAEKPTLASNLDELIRYLEDFEPFSLESAQRKPQAFTLGGTRNNKRGGMVVWRNDIFPVDFFVRRNADWRTAGGKDARRFLSDLQRQPWFQWDGRAFTCRPTGAGERILAMFKAASGNSQGTSLYRGTTTYEALVLEYGQALATRRPLDPNWRESLKAARAEIAAHAEKFYRAYEKGIAEKWATPDMVAEKRAKWETVVKRNQDLAQKADAAKDDAAIRTYLRECMIGLLSQGDFCGLFTTPDRERAKLFSKGRVLEFALDWGKVAEIQKTGRLYIGFEKMGNGNGEDVQVEIAFLGAGDDPAGTRWLADVVISAFRGSKPEQTSQLFN